MENQALFSSNDKSKKFKCRVLQFLFGALRVNIYTLNTKKREDAKYRRIPTFYP